PLASYAYTRRNYLSAFCARRRPAPFKITQKRRAVLKPGSSAVAFLMSFAALPGLAANDTWTQSSNLVTPDWRSGSNWPMGAPPGPNDTAVFDSTARIRTPDIIGIYVTVQALQFNPGAPSYTITMSNFGANFGQQTGPDSV